MPTPAAADELPTATDARSRGAVSTLIQGMIAAAFIGGVWGAAEALGRIAFYRFVDQTGVRAIPSHGPLDVAAAAVLAGLEYAAAGAAVGLVAVAVLAPLLAVLFPRRSAEWRLFVAPRFLVLAFALFANLFWWSRYAIHFAYSERFYSSKRLLLTAALALAALALAARLTALLRRARRVPGPLRAAVLIILVAASAGFLLRERRLLAGEPAAAGASGRHNVVLFVLDALRADHLGCYGYPRPTSPRIDQLAREGVLFERAVVQAPYTWTSFGSLLTGKYPRKHGLLKMDPTVRFDPKRNETLQTILDRAGYSTGAFLTGMLSNASGLIDGFETYFEANIGRDVVRRSSVWTFFRSELVLRKAWNKVRQALDPTMVVDEAVDWIDGHRDRRFFALIHLYATHTPYDPPQRYDIFSPDYRGEMQQFTHDMAEVIVRNGIALPQDDLQRVTDLYDGGVLFEDAMVGGVIEALVRRELLDDTIVIVTSDHGEELGDRGIWEHNWMYNTNQLVPLVVRMPDGAGAGRRVAPPVEQIDVLPTLLEHLGIAAPPEVDGASLLPWFRGETPETDAYAFCENFNYISVQNTDWKLIRFRGDDPEDPPRLYHLAADPGERRNLYLSNPPALAELSRVLDQYDRSMPRPVELTVPLDPINEALLNQGGYTSGASEKEGHIERRRGAGGKR